MRSALVWFAALACVEFGARPASAHDYWLELSTYRPAPGVTVAVAHRVGEQLAGEAVPRNPDAIVRFDAVASDGNPRPIGGQAGVDPAGQFQAAGNGAAAIVYQSRSSLVELPPEKFREYLLTEGLEMALDLREKLGEGRKVAREAFSRSAVAVACGAGPRGPARAPSIAGLELEIVPDADLCWAKPGESLSFRVLRDGEPAAGLLMMALSRANPFEPMKARSDAEGRFNFRLAAAGFWLIKGVQMERSHGRPEADWQSRWASLTFELRESRN